MLSQIRDTLGSPPFVDQAVRDTISAIAADPAYNRALGQSMWDRLLRFVFEQLRRLFEAMEGVPYGRIIVSVLVALAVAITIARLVMGIVAERRAGDANRQSGATAKRAAQLSDAERLAASGEYTAAAHVLFAVVLAAGSARGEFRVHPSKTLGDYARDIRKRATGWYQPFSAFRSRFDRVMYGDTACSADDYQRLLSDVRAMLANDRVA